MRRIFAAFLCLCLLALPALCAMPVEAQEKPWTTLTYVYDPVAEGEAGERGELDGSESSADHYMQFVRTITVSCDTAQAKLYVNGEQVDAGEARLSLAGDYDVRVESRDGRGAKTHYIEILPELDFGSGYVFTSNPVIACANATSIQILKAGKAWDAAAPLTEFGEYRLKVYGIEDQSPFEYTVYVRYCKAEPVWDEASGKQALKITVGEFPGVALTAELDGVSVPAGETIVSAVGQHTLTAQVNGAEAETSLMPSAAELLLQVSMYLDTLDAKEPFFFDLTPWNANFYLDGNPVSGKIRVTGNGEHTLTIRDADGNDMKGMILLRTQDDNEFRTVDGVTFTFRNPHRIYAIAAAVPAILLFGAALYFLLARRKIV